MLHPAAAAADLDRLYDEYRSTGVIRGCAYSPAELRRGLAEMPVDIRAYDPGFGDALNAALEQRAACGAIAGLVKGGPAGADGSAAADGSPGPARPPPAAVTGALPAGDAEGAGLQSAGLVIAAVLGALAFALAAGLGRRAARRP
jgi:hypothetical protein